MEEVQAGFEHPTQGLKTTAQENNGEGNCEKASDQAELIKDFGSYTTLHGFHFISDSGSIHRRIFWLCLMIFCFASLIIQVMLDIQRLNSNETRVRKSVELADSLEFPAITICNQNMLKKSKIRGTKAQDYLDQLDSLKFRMGEVKNENVPPFDMEKVVRESGHGIKEMINECEFKNKECSSRNFTPSKMSSMYGNCYTFNAGNNGSEIQRVTASGKMQSLTLRLDSEPDEYYGPFSYEATGFRISVHEQGRYHNIKDEGYDISPGFYTSIRIKKNKEKSLPPPYYSMCGSRKLMNYERYSQVSCRDECLSKLLAKTCNCRVFSMVKKGINVTRFCSTDEIKSCISPVYRLGHSSCDCPQQCEVVTYKLQLSTAYHPSDHLWHAIIPWLIKTIGLNATNSTLIKSEEVKNLYRKKFALVNIFFETLDTDVVQEFPGYTLSSFWSDLGGNMGLLLGCSVMTVFEFVDLLIRICMFRSSKNKLQVAKKEYRITANKALTTRST